MKSDREHVVFPELPYAFDALEPFVSKEVLEVHYGKHHQAYVTNLNKALEKYVELEKANDLAGMVVQMRAIAFNAGGHLNHTFFWDSLAPVSAGGGKMPQGELVTLIEKEFGSLEVLIEKMSAKTVAVQGSGWGWLGYCAENESLVLTTTLNQDLLEAQGLLPLLCIDVWEHAYYLQYKNVRPEFVKNIWNVVNWKRVEERYLKRNK
jgi:Fe-Mn family superoxide dismutase